ncbi:MAG: serine hydrolase domain-containing protein [Roseobacter sp.]
MRSKPFKWLGLLLGVVLLAAIGAALWKKPEIERLLAVNSLFEPDRIVQNFSAMNRAFLYQPMTVAPATPLPEGPPVALPDSLQGWMQNRQVTSMVILHKGARVYETYRLGTGRDDLRIGWSISKSYLSALTGIILAEGKIGSLEDRVIDYAPALRDGAYHRATIRHVLNMATGVTFDEDYADQKSDINRMGRVLALGQEMDVFAAGLQDTFTEPGVDWQYVSIDTHVLAMVIRGATGRSITDLIREKIIVPLGSEQPPYYLTDGVGVAFALGGINATTRDYARFGQMFLQGGTWKGQQIVPRDWVTLSTTATAPTTEAEMGYGFQWWIPHAPRPREYMARGIYGQYLYINDIADVVIAVTAVDPDFRADAVKSSNVAMFRLIADTL